MLLHGFRVVKPERKAEIGAPAPRWKVVASTPRSEDSWKRDVPRDAAKLLVFASEEEMDQDDLLERIAQAETKAAFQRVVDFVSRCERSSYSMRDKLRSEGYRADIVDATIERALDLNLLDDTRYLELFIRSRRGRGWGDRRILQALRHEGFDPADAKDAFPDSEESETDRAYATIETRSLPDKDPVGRLAARLMRKGFSSEAAFGAARRRVEDEA